MNSEKWAVGTGGAGFIGSQLADDSPRMESGAASSSGHLPNLTT
jgi:hypothetical protein